MSINNRRQRHVDHLARELGCEVHQGPNVPGMMYVEYEPPMIEGPTIVHQYDYLVMLHELGHVFHSHTQGRPPFGFKTFYFDNGVLRSEAEAWLWAIEQTADEEELSEETRTYMWDRCLGSYLNGAVRAQGSSGNRLGNGNRHHVAFTYDVPGHFFWSVAERLAGRSLETVKARTTSVLGYRLG